MKKLIAAAVLGVSVLWAHMGAAQTCGGIYRVQPGDSLSVIADRLYKNAGMWTAIHNRNIAAIGPLTSDKSSLVIVSCGFLVTPRIT